MACGRRAGLLADAHVDVHFRIALLIAVVAGVIVRAGCVVALLHDRALMAALVVAVRIVAVRTLALALFLVFAFLPLLLDLAVPIPVLLLDFAAVTALAGDGCAIAAGFSCSLSSRLGHR